MTSSGFEWPRKWRPSQVAGTELHFRKWCCGFPLGNGLSSKRECLPAVLKRSFVLAYMRCRLPQGRAGFGIRFHPPGLFRKISRNPSFWLFCLLGVSGKWGLIASFCGTAFSVLTGSGCLFCPSFPIIQRKGVVWSPWRGSFLGFLKNRRIFVLILPLFSCKIRMNTGISPISCLCVTLSGIQAGVEAIHCQLLFSVLRWYNRDRPHGLTDGCALNRAIDRAVNHAIERVVKRHFRGPHKGQLPWWLRLRMNRNAFTRQQHNSALTAFMT